VAWRNAPNISYDDIIGYEIQFINSAMNQNVTEHLDASASFYNLDNLNEAFKSGLTYVQVGNEILRVVPYSLVIFIQLRVVSSEHSGKFSPLKSLGTLSLLTL
jgi:hypothetical protein